MEYKEKIRIVNIVFTVVIILTLLAAVGMFIYGLIDMQTQNANLNFEDDKDKFSYAFRFMGIVAFIFMLLPIFISECDFFLDARYFVQPKSYRDKFKTALNILFGIFSVTTILAFIVLTIVGINFEDILFNWLIGFLCYIFLRIIYIIYATVKNRRENKYYLDT